MRRKCNNKEEDLNREHMFPRASRYKRGSDITKSDITEVRLYLWGDHSKFHLKTTHWRKFGGQLIDFNKRIWTCRTCQTSNCHSSNSWIKILRAQKRDFLSNEDLSSNWTIVPYILLKPPHSVTLRGQPFGFGYFKKSLREWVTK